MSELKLRSALIQFIEAAALKQDGSSGADRPFRRHEFTLATRAGDANISFGYGYTTLGNVIVGTEVLPTAEGVDRFLAAADLDK